MNKLNGETKLHSCEAHDQVTSSTDVIRSWALPERKVSISSFNFVFSSRKVAHVAVALFFPASAIAS